MTQMPLDFSSMIGSAQRGEVLIPIVHKALYDPDFKGFNVPVRAWSGRAYDGRFHPSTHSTLTVRQLYLYLTRPDLLEEERMDLSSVLAVTAGSFWHEFLQYLFMDDGIMIRQRPEVVDGVNPAEVRVVDPEHNRVGHADGELTNGDIVELKTINDFQIYKIDNEMVLKEKKPQYFSQTQDYLDVLGRDRMRYLFLAPSYPYPMGEFVVHADPVHQRRRRAEYRLALDLAEQHPDGSAVDQVPPLVSECCAPKSQQSKNCFARLSCPVGRFR